MTNYKGEVMTNPAETEKLKKAYRDLSVAVIKVAVQDYKRKTHWADDAHYFIENIKKFYFGTFLMLVVQK